MTTGYNGVPKDLPSVEDLKQIFDYEPDTGVLRWKQRYGDEPGVAIFNGKHAGNPAGAPHCRGYRQVAFKWKGRRIKALVHRVCFSIHYGHAPHMVDHRNNVRDDNRAANLRDADASKNQCNRSIAGAKSGLKGVYTHQCTGKFFSQILIKGRYEFLGVFETKEDCARAYDAAAVRLHGEFARTNASLNLIGA